MARYYTQKMQRGEEPSSDLGGRAFQSLVEANCRRNPDKAKTDDVIEFRSEYKYYDRCAQRYECSE